MRPEDCALVILASGLSERFGTEDKLMAELDEKPILQYVIDAVVSIPFAERYSVISVRSKARRSLLGCAGFTLIENPNPKAGQGGSLSLAAKAVLAAGHKSMCLVLGDMPFVSVKHILDIMIGMEDKDRAISYCNNNFMPPAIFTGLALRMLVGIDSRTGAKSLFLSEGFYKHPLSQHAAQDIDTPEILASLQGTT